jgi:hypothetical protein
MEPFRGTTDSKGFKINDPDCPRETVFTQESSDRGIHVRVEARQRLTESKQTMNVYQSPYAEI